jgi:hypothetical protein
VRIAPALAVVLAALAAGCGGGDPVETPCSGDGDCPVTRECVAGRCRLRPFDGGGLDAPDAPRFDAPIDAAAEVDASRDAPAPVDAAPDARRRDSGPIECGLVPCPGPSFFCEVTDCASITGTCRSLRDPSECTPMPTAPVCDCGDRWYRTMCDWEADATHGDSAIAITGCCRVGGTDCAAGMVCRPRAVAALVGTCGPP